MKQPRQNISSYIAKTSLKDGINKKLTKEIAAYLLIEKRSSELESILRDVWQDWSDKGVVEVKAVSAFAFSTKTESDIRAEVKKVYPNAKKIIISPQHDPGVISGVKLELANQQLDLTALSKLNKFKQLTAS